MDDLTKEQSSAAKGVSRWLAEPGGDWMFSLAGFAGTGKTFLLQRIINDLGPDGVICCAPTGKAASVLQRKLDGIHVKTLHQALYVPQDRALQDLEELLRKLEAAGADTAEERQLKQLVTNEKKRLSTQDVRFSARETPLITDETVVIVDEASMVHPKIVRDLRATGCKALFVGDPGQLPPVKGDNWFLERKHNATLVSIQRQARDSPIIRLSMDIRNMELRSSQYQFDDCRITRKSKVPHDEWMAADQILTGRNASRHKINRFVRKKLGLPQGVRDDAPDIMEGEKLICLKNDWSHSPPFINGVQFTSDDHSVLTENGEDVLDFTYEGAAKVAVPFYTNPTRGHYADVEPEPPEFRRGLFECDFAYAVTVHKSQGSEWPFVLVADDEMQKGDREFRKRWLYTAVTRAQSKLLLVQ